jgi:hypothetical protein
MKTALLFPGQGSQQPHMLHGLVCHPAVDETLSEVSAVLNLDVRTLDTPEALQSEVSVQLATLTAGGATVRALQQSVLRPLAVAGLSVGAFSAAVAADSISLSDAVRLVRSRAEQMERMYPVGYGLSAIIGLSETQVAKLVDAAIDRPRTRRSILPKGLDTRLPSQPAQAAVCTLPTKMPGRKFARRVKPMPRTVSSFIPITRAQRNRLRSVLPSAEKADKTGRFRLHGGHAQRHPQRRLQVVAIFLRSSASIQNRHPCGSLCSEASLSAWNLGVEKRTGGIRKGPKKPQFRSPFGSTPHTKSD